MLPVAVTLIFSGWQPAEASKADKTGEAQSKLANLEKKLGGRLGLFALDTASGFRLSHRSDERFPVCSTFKVLAVAAVLSKSQSMPALLDRRINYAQGNVVSHSPITQKHIKSGMTVRDLCAAAIRYSDNTAGNLLMRLLGGPSAVSAYARSLGDTQFRLERWETALNTAIPKDPRDTSTPQAMGVNLQKLVLGSALQPPQREQLRQWLVGNTTGAARIKSGLPGNWKLGDKTGGGDYGTANDIAVIWPPTHQPIILAIYTTRDQKNAVARNDIIAAATRIVVNWLRE